MTEHTPYDAELERLFKEYKAGSPTAKDDREQQWYMMALAEGYRRCQADYAPLLEAAKAGWEFLDWWLRTSQVEQVNALHGEKGNAMIGRLKMQREQLRAAIDAAERRSA